MRLFFKTVSAIVLLQIVWLLSCGVKAPPLSPEGAKDPVDEETETQKPSQ